MSVEEEVCRVEGCESARKPGRQGRCSTHYWRDYRASRRDELNANYKAWAKKRGSRRKYMTDEQKLQERLRGAMYRARDMGVEVCEFTIRDFRRMEARQDGRCAYCRKKSKWLQMDHVIPLIRGGRHSAGNLVLACADCNKSKSAMLPMRWRMYKEKGWLQEEPPPAAPEPQVWDQEPF